MGFAPPEVATPATGVYQPGLTHQAKKEIAEQPAWLEFIQKHGGGYQVVWDEFTGTPHRVFGPGIRLSSSLSEDNLESVCRQFIQDEARLLRVDYGDLRLSSAAKYGRIWYVTYDQYYNGIPVYMGRIDLRLDDEGRLMLFGSDCHPGIDLSVNPQVPEKSAVGIVRNHLNSTSPYDQHLSTRLYIYPVVDGGQIVYHLAFQIIHRTVEPLGKWVYFVDAHSGQILGYYNDLKFIDYEGHVTGWIQEETPFDPWVIKSFKDLRVDVTGVGFDHTDQEGYYLIPYTGGDNHDVRAELKGFWVDVNNQAGWDAIFSGNFPPGVIDIDWSDINSTGAERCGYYHTVLCHDFIKWLDRDYTGTDYQMACNVSVVGECNAYWDGSAINFYRAGSRCPEIVQIADVVYHEYGHGITDFLYGSNPLPYWDESGGLNEGWADFIGGVITDQHLIGRGFWGEGTWLRNLEDPDHSQYPGEECGGEPHCMGEIIGGAIWDIRNNLIAAYGEEYGKIYMDSLWHYPRYGYPTTFYDYLVEQLIFDDDNGNIYDGTPNYPYICDAYAQHDTIGDPGMLCPEIQYGVFIMHEPLGDTPDTQNSHPVVATIYSTEGAMNPDSLLVFYRNDEGPLLPLLMSPLGGDEYEAHIPPQLNGTFVDYYILGVDLLANRKTHPEGAPEFLHSFYVGTFDTAFVDDMEGGVGDWTHYAVTGGYADMWSLREHRNHTPAGSYAWKCGDSTQYGGNYKDTLDAALVTPPIDIQDHSKLIFWHWINAETSASYTGKCYDGGLVEVSVNGGPFEQITPEGGYPFEIHSDCSSSPFPGGTPVYSGFHDWERAEFIIEGYEGEAQFRFRFGTDSAVVREGWYIDDVTVVLPHPRPLPEVSGVLVPHNPPIVIPPEGGRFNFDVYVANNTGEQKRVDAWIMVTLPDGSLHGPVKRRVIDLEPYQRRRLNNLAQNVPGYAPSGEYTYTGYLGVYPDSVIDRSWFDFTKTGVTFGEAMLVDNWNLLGWGDERPTLDLPASFALRENIPNPFNLTTKIGYALPGGCEVELAIYNLLGQEVRILVDEYQQAGYKSILWDGRDEGGNPVSSGVYFYRLSAGEFSKIHKMTLLK